MNELKEVKAVLNHRLRPLYVASFLQSLVLWYTIEKLFMRTIGFDNTGIGFMVAAYSVVMLMVETPSGILADRWSRKGMLIVASVCLGFSSLLGGLSNGFALYLLSALFWGAFFACYSGMYDTIIYDTIAEADAPSSLFDSLFGRIQFMDSSALVLGGLGGGLVAQFVSLRATYFLTIPFVLLSVFALLAFHEPTLHKKQAAMPIGTQIRLTLQAVLKNRSLVPVIVALIVRSTLAYCIYEFSQLWLLDLHTPTAWYGLATAVLLSSIGIGGVMAERLGLSRFKALLLTLTTTLLGCIGLVIFRNTALIVLAQFVFATGLISIYVIFSRLLHDELSPSVRAGAASATSTIGRILIIPVALLIGYTSQRFTIFQASYILLGFTVLLCVFVIRVGARRGRMGLFSLGQNSSH